ncbi:DNA primase [Alteromonadaceae bacterium BrNp21-10]|nr:DNA primase [Alteromonadaceae bacterium BrNp21-10]
MAGRIPRDFIDDLIARSDVVEIVDSRVKLKKAGKNYQACCPFHSEKSPSFTVSQDKQFYHCFGCGAHGNVISFLMEYDRLEFPEAVEELARYHSIDVPREKDSGPSFSPAQKQQREDDYELLEKVARFFAHQLKHHPKSANAIEYLKNRGLSGDVVKNFGIGFAPPEWDGALKQFSKDSDSQQQLLDLKIITENDNGKRFDFFRDRIMFPIRDKRGRVIGFGGRVLENSDGPKYLNSPETRVFHKGNELYGFYQAKQANRTLHRTLIVEGYMDVVALAQFDINYAVASLGTATTAEHIQTLFRAAPQIICCYDGDRAGRDAAWRALNNALPYLKDGVEMKFLFLPDGEDPDTLVRQIGKEAFEEKLNTDAVPLSQFLFDTLLKTHHVGSDEGKAALRTEIDPLLAQIPGENQKELLELKATKLTGISRSQAQVKQTKVDNSQEFSQPNKHKQTHIQTMLRLLLEQPMLASQCPEVVPSLLDSRLFPGLSFLQEVHEYCLLKSNRTSGQIIEHFREHQNYKALAKLAIHDLSNNSDDLNEFINANKITEFKDTFTRMVDKQIASRIDELQTKSAFNKLSEQELQEFMLLLKERDV